MIDSKDDGGLLKCKKIELNEVEEKSTLFHQKHPFVVKVLKYLTLVIIS